MKKLTVVTLVVLPHVLMLADGLYTNPDFVILSTQKVKSVALRVYFDIVSPQPYESVSKLADPDADPDHDPLTNAPAIGKLF